MDEVRLVVSDDGKGFEAEKLPRPSERQSGFGLAGLQERLAQLGGTFQEDLALSVLD